MPPSQYSADDADIIRRIEAEHEELRELLGTIHLALADELSVAQVTRLLQSLADELQVHFNDEEEQGFFSQITDQAPRLSNQAEQLCREHDDMLSDVLNMINEARRGDGSATWRKELGDTFHTFSKRLMRHESNESDMLQQAYGEDVGGVD